MRASLLALIFIFAILSIRTDGRRVFGKGGNKGMGTNANKFSGTLSGITGKLHKRAVDDAKENGVENVVISPFSIAVSLGMTLLGARANTKKEVERFTRWQFTGENDVNVHNVMRKMINRATDNSKGVTFNATNAMFMEEEFSVAEQYLKVIMKNYTAEITSLDFANEPDDSAAEINGWIADKTGLENAIPDGTITSLTKMVLVNVVNFVGQWNTAFSPDTKNIPFKPHFDELTAFDVPYLVKSKLPILLYSSTNLRKDVEATFFAIPYEGETNYMVIGKPDSLDDFNYINENLEDILIKIKPIQSSGWRGGWSKHSSVDVSIPKFDVSQEFDVKNALEKEGVRELFNVNKCDLSGITESQNGLYVSDFLHKAKVQVDAEGTKASAVTVQHIAFRSARIPPAPIVVDVPFFFGIYNAKINAFLFTGVVNNPASN